jgi:hypothetical protein
MPRKVPLPTKTGRRKPKATRAVARARTDDVIRLILDGAMPWDLRAYVAEQEAKGEPPWTVPPHGKPLSPAPLKRYYRKAEQAIGETALADRQQLIRTHVAMRRALYARSLAAGDNQTALRAARDEAELLALYPPERRELSGPGGAPLAVNVADLSEAERLDRLRQLVAVARQRQLALPYHGTVNGSANGVGGAGGP